MPSLSRRVSGKSVLFIAGSLALAIALPLSAAFAFFMSQWFLNLFNIDYAMFQFSRSALLLQVVAALLAPLLAGAGAELASVNTARVSMPLEYLVDGVIGSIQ